MSRGASENLTGVNSLTFSKGSAGSEDTKSLYFGTTGDRCSHSDE